MSDNDNNGAWSNYGFTLPDGEDATYNIMLSPLFILQAGSRSLSPVIGSRGTNGHFWTSSIDQQDGSLMFYTLSSRYVVPSYNDVLKTYATSLRCLVSTNNG